MGKICGENKIKEILLLDDMYKKSVLLALTGIKCKERSSKLILRKGKTWDLRGSGWDNVYCITEIVWKENWGGVKFKK